MLAWVEGEDNGVSSGRNGIVWVENESSVTDCDIVGSGVNSGSGTNSRKESEG